MDAQVSNSFDRASRFASVATLGGAPASAAPEPEIVPREVSEAPTSDSVALIMLPDGLAGEIAAANTRLGYRITKRSFDIVVAALGLAILSPVFLMIAMLIVMTSPGPAIFRQTRCGKDGKPFTCYKFRTMVNDAELLLKHDEHLRSTLVRNWKLSSDPRVTRVGRFLRRSSVDELPQLFNVLRGEMSLVGPRPVQPAEFMQQYGTVGAIVFSVKPGLTGLWQVSGRSAVTYTDRIRLDLQYVQNPSISMDMKIILMTIPRVLIGRGAL